MSVRAVPTTPGRRELARARRRRRCAARPAPSAPPRCRGCSPTCRGSPSSRPRAGPGSARSSRPASRASSTGSGWATTTPFPGDTAAAVFGAAPRSMTGVITLGQTVDLVRLGIEVVESHVDEVVDPADAPGRPCRRPPLRPRGRLRHRRGLRPGRRGARRLGRPARGARRRLRAPRRGRRGRRLAGQRARLGPPRRRHGRPRAGARRRASRTSSTRYAASARGAGMDALCATQGDRLVVILGGVTDADKAAHAVVRFFGDGPVVVGPRADDLASAHVSARAALSGLRAAVGWPDAPRPVASDDLLPERVLAGDGHARRHLVEAVFVPLRRRQGHAHRHADGVLPARPVARGDRPRAVRPPQHRALPAAPGRRADRPVGHRPAGGAHAAARARARPPGAPAHAGRGRCRNPTKFVGRVSCAPDAHGTPPTRKAGARARHRRSRSGSPDPRLPHPLARGPDVRLPLPVAVDRRRASTWPTTAPRRTPRPSATPRSPSRCWSPPG